MTHLIEDYVANGLIQFGRFKQADGSVWPIAFNFLLLPSYPQTMKATASAFAPILKRLPIQRLLSTRATTPLGAALSIETNIPLAYVYGEQKAYTSAYVIEGAYDVGHPTALVQYVQDANPPDILPVAEKVGLPITDVVSLFSIGAMPDLNVTALFDFNDTLTILRESGTVPPRMVEQVLEWLG